MSIKLVLDPASVTETTEYIAAMQESILVAIREGMKEAMEGLADTAIAGMDAAGIVEHKGELREAIWFSPKVTETPEVIRGTVASDVGKKHLGLWLEEGTHVPAVEGKLFEFTEPDGKSYFTHGHMAFDVKPHPFLNPALHEYETTITQIIADAIGGALEGDAIAA